MSLLDKLRKPFVVSAVSLGVLLASAGCASQEATPRLEDITFGAIRK